jgi:hypothetical protein
MTRQRVASPPVVSAVVPHTPHAPVSRRPVLTGSPSVARELSEELQG